MPAALPTLSICLGRVEKKQHSCLITRRSAAGVTGLEAALASMMPHALRSGARKFFFSRQNVLRRHGERIRTPQVSIWSTSLPPLFCPKDLRRRLLAGNDPVILADEDRLVCALVQFVPYQLHLRWGHEQVCLEPDFAKRCPHGAGELRGECCIGRPPKDRAVALA